MKKSKKGQLMMEALFSLSVVVVVLLALSAGAVISLRNAQHSQNMVLANHYAYQAMETVRGYKQMNGFDSLFEGCYGEVSVVEVRPVSCDSWGDVGETIFKRRIVVADEGADKKKVDVYIGWADAACESGEYCRQSTLASLLTRWQ